MPVQLTSPQNSQLKEALKLEKRSERAQRRLTLVEGAREVARALEAGILPVEAFVCPAFVDAEVFQEGDAEAEDGLAVLAGAVLVVVGEESAAEAVAAVDAAAGEGQGLAEEGLVGAAVVVARGIEVGVVGEGEVEGAHGLAGAAVGDILFDEDG